MGTPPHRLRCSQGGSFLPEPKGKTPKECASNCQEQAGGGVSRSALPDMVGPGEGGDPSVSLLFSLSGAGVGCSPLSVMLMMMLRRRRPGRRRLTETNASHFLVVQPQALGSALTRSLNPPSSLGSGRDQPHLGRGDRLSVRGLAKVTELGSGMVGFTSRGSPPADLCPHRRVEPWGPPWRRC